MNKDKLYKRRIKIKIFATCARSHVLIDPFDLQVFKMILESIFSFEKNKIYTPKLLEMFI